MAKNKAAAHPAKEVKNPRRERLQSYIDKVKKAMQDSHKLVPFLAFAIVAIAFCFDASAGTSLAICASAKYALLYASPDGSVKSGRAGSVVYMRNGRRRNFVVPSLVQNDYTQTVRATFGINSNAWNGLTEGERAGWNNAVGFTYVNRFGETKILKGKALYVRLNQNLAICSLPPITVCPLPEDIVGLETMAITLDLSAGFELAFTPTPTQDGTTTIVMATMPLPAGYSRPSASRYRKIMDQTNVGGQPSPILFQPAYNTKFGAPPIGSKIFVKAFNINNTTGQASPVNITSGLVVA